ncbi:MAG: hypothetical protein AABX35_02195 [Nanoarchaeota archaeon]
MAFNIDFSASAQFKGHNQKPLWLADGRGLFRPSLQRITQKAISRGLDMVVLRSYSHPEGTDNRWQHYLKQAKEEYGFTTDTTKEQPGMIVYRNFYGSLENPSVIVHGQGLQTTAGDIQILFADRQIGARKPTYNPDFDYLVREAREDKDTGKNVIITASKPYRWKESDLRKVDAIEVHNGLDSFENNLESQRIAQRLKIPGIVVSNSKCLTDLGSSYSMLRDISPEERYNPEALSNALKRELKSGLSGSLISSSLISRAITGLAVLEVKATGNVD